MAKKSRNTSSYLNKRSRRTLFLFFFCILLISCSSLALFYNLYQVSKNNIINMWSNSALEMFKDVEFYLNTPKDAVRFTSIRVEEMMKDGASNEEINQYLINETSVYSTLIESNSTGIYGYVNGEYLDGSGWITPDDYDPKSRPWYISAKEQDGDIALVEPFLNLQTETMMMSVSVLLNDKDSVVSMDIFLDNIQDIDERMARNEDVDIAMVLDESGIVVAHSDIENVGINYLTEGDELQKAIADTIINSQLSTFSYKTDSGEKIAFCNEINNQWYAVLILDENNVFGSIKYIYVLSSVTIGVILLIFFILFTIYNSNQREVYDLQDDIQAVADIYDIMYMLDLKTKTIKNLRNIMSDRDSAIIKPSFDDVGELAGKLASETSKELLINFMDITTFNERLKDLQTISHEYLDNENKWSRMQLVVVSREKDGSISKVLATIQSIDADKRQQESLKQQAETDGLTQILNRKGGESRINEYLLEGKSGLLLILDADNFKHVNDTYGHDMGDIVIITLAQCLMNTFRDSDVVYRLGGDEFAVFALDVETSDIARIMIDRLFAAIDFITFDGITDWKLNISVGAAFLNKDNRQEFTLICKHADTAMYESKQHKGKNSFTLYNDDVAE